MARNRPEPLSNLDPTQPFMNTHAQIKAWETANDARIYGAGVEFLPYQRLWQCRSADRKTLVQAPTLDLLLEKYVHAWRPSKSPYLVQKDQNYHPAKTKKPYKHSNPNLALRPEELVAWELDNQAQVRGYNVQYYPSSTSIPKTPWGCKDQDKKLTLFFSTLEELIAECPYVVKY